MLNSRMLPNDLTRSTWCRKKNGLVVDINIYYIFHLYQNIKTPHGLFDQSNTQSFFLAGTVWETPKP